MDNERLLLIAGLTFITAITLFILWGPNAFQRRKGPGHIAGLVNMGNTCFLNTLLQAFASCPSILKWLSKHVEKEDDSLASALHTAIIVINGQHINIQDNPYNPGFVIKALFSKGWVITPSEQDAHELFHVILTTLEEETQKYKRIKLCSLSDALGSSHNISSCCSDTIQNRKSEYYSKGLLFPKKNASQCVSAEKNLQGDLVPSLLSEDEAEEKEVSDTENRSEEQETVFEGKEIERNVPSLENGEEAMCELNCEESINEASSDLNHSEEEMLISYCNNDRDLMSESMDQNLISKTVKGDKICLDNEISAQNKTDPDLEGSDKMIVDNSNIHAGDNCAQEEEKYHYSKGEISCSENWSGDGAAGETSFNEFTDIDMKNNQILPVNISYPFNKTKDLNKENQEEILPCGRAKQIFHGDHSNPKRLKTEDLKCNETEFESNNVSVPILDNNAKIMQSLKDKAKRNIPHKDLVSKSDRFIQHRDKDKDDVLKLVDGTKHGGMYRKLYFKNSSKSTLYLPAYKRILDSQETCRSTEPMEKIIDNSVLSRVPIQKPSGLVGKNVEFVSPFQGLMTSQLTCTVCGFKTAVHYDKFDSISLPLPNVNAWGNELISLKSLLTTFVSTENIPGVECENCSRNCSENIVSVKSTAMKAVAFGKFPLCLCFHIPRTMWLRGFPSKRDDYVSFPESLSMDPYTYSFQHKKCVGITSNKPEMCAKCMKHQYILRAVVVHMGDVNSGHFITYRRSVRNDQRWFFTSDSEVKEVNKNQVFKSCAYMLFYEKAKKK